VCNADVLALTSLIGLEACSQPAVSEGQKVLLERHCLPCAPKIAGEVRIIGALAAHTNLLGLNARIEVARAGNLDGDSPDGGAAATQKISRNVQQAAQSA